MVFVGWMILISLAHDRIGGEKTQLLFFSVPAAANLSRNTLVVPFNLSWWNRWCGMNDTLLSAKIRGCVGGGLKWNTYNWYDLDLFQSYNNNSHIFSPGFGHIISGSPRNFQQRWHIWSVSLEASVSTDENLPSSHPWYVWYIYLHKEMVDFYGKLVQ